MIFLGAAVGTLGAASSALACSLLPPGLGTVGNIHVDADAAGPAFVSWERQGEPREGAEPRAVVLGPHGGWTWADPVDAPAPASAPAVTYPARGFSSVVGLGAGGHAVAMWRVTEPVPAIPGAMRRAIDAADRGPDGTWSAEYTLAGLDTPNPPPPHMCANESYGGPAVAVDAAGNSVAAWVERDPEPVGKVLKWVARPSGGAWSAPTTLGPAGTDLGLTMDASGTALLTWNEGGLLRSAVRPAGGVFGAAENLGGASSGWWGFGSLTPSVTLDRTGRALAVWGADHDRVVAATRAPGGPWSAPVDLSKLAENPPPLISAVRLSRTRLHTGATALSFRMRAGGNVRVVVQRNGRGPAVRGVKVRAARGVNRVVLLSRPLPPGVYTVEVRARAKDWAPASRSKRVVVLPRG